jgi:hypothetical protein
MRLGGQYCLFHVTCHCSLAKDQVTMASRFARCRGNDSQLPVKYLGTTRALLTNFSVNRPFGFNCQQQTKYPQLQVQDLSYNNLNTLVQSQVSDPDRVVALTSNRTEDDWSEDDFDKD